MRYGPTLVEHFLNPRTAGMERALAGLPDDRKHAADVAASALRAAAFQCQARRD
jgi:hypothetical protein